MMKIYLIAIGGAVMHNMALALKENGHQVSGSDDEIRDPSKSRLLAAGLLPDQMGWDANRIDDSIDAIILGMHARLDNPELVRAQELGLKVYSFPEFVYEHSKEKKRVVIAGSHGKTTTTSMIMHALKKNKIDFDYLVGAQLDGFETMVRLSEAPIIILEGDEYLSSPLDRRPKFLHYKPDVALITGIAWDHINVFPTFENYLEQFMRFAEDLKENKAAFIYAADPELKKISEVVEGPAWETYATFKSKTSERGSLISFEGVDYQVSVFGEHNLSNMMGAMKVCKELGLQAEDFLNSMHDFKGAARRLELLKQTEHQTVYRDFAHAPSKVHATVKAVRAQHQNKKVIAVLELHTFSSLNADFLGEYAGSLAAADQRIVFYNPATVAHKKLSAISKEDVRKGFDDETLRVFNKSEEFAQYLIGLSSEECVCLLMSSGGLAGVDINKLFGEA